MRLPSRIAGTGSLAGVERWTLPCLAATNSTLRKRMQRTRIDCTAFEVNDDFEQITYTLKRHGRTWRHGMLGNAPTESCPGSSTA
jgi:hypothetical protein